MRVASNKLKDITAFFHSELKDIYSVSEIEAMIDAAVERYLGFSKTERLTKASENLNQSDLLKLYDCCKDLAKHIPLQYILGEAWFYNLKFYVNNSVLIPRPETEELADLIIRENAAAGSFLDIGTGSGCIPVTLKNKLPNANIFACDISPQALAVALKNAQSNHSAVTFFEADVLNTNTFLKQLPVSAVDVIVSNPPYIKESEAASLDKHVIDQEPHLALFVKGDDDIVFYKKIIDLCEHLLKPSGKLYFELNPLTASFVNRYALASGLFESTELLKDMSGNTRFLKAVKL